MAYKQEPCPLCGRNMTAIETYPGRGELYCGHCDLTIGGNDAKTPEELIALMDGSEHRRLKAENDALRKLVRDMWPHVRYRSRMCASCDLPCDTSDECLLYEPMRQRMRGLGVETGEQEEA